MSTRMDLVVWRRNIARTGCCTYMQSRQRVIAVEISALCRYRHNRHTWASLHVQQGSTPLYALQELGGWKSSEMVRRYAHLAAEHLAPYADRLCALRVVEAAEDRGVPGDGHVLVTSQKLKRP